MARPLRIEFVGALYHVTVRGNAQENIYRDDTDREQFLALLQNAVYRYDWYCHAYCLMDNHYHLLIETGAPTLSTSAPRFFAKAEMGSVRFQQRKIAWRLLPSAAPIRPASVPLRHIIVYSMRLRSTPTNGFTPCRDALYFAPACASSADSGKTPGATAIGD